MKPFIVFAGDYMYPRGGINDRQGAYLSLDDALRAARDSGEWWHIYDTRTDSVVRWSYEEDEAVAG